MGNLRFFAGGVFLLVGIGLFVRAAFLTWERYAPKRVTTLTEKAMVSYGLPKTIKIPSIEVNLGIIPAKLVGQRWEATREGVSYLTSSPLPGEKGNSILYGHNWPSLLGKLPKVKVGEKIEIGFDGDKKRSFRVTETKDVKSNGIEILRETADPQITIYTCDGFFDRKRFVVVATLEK